MLGFRVQGLGYDRWTHHPIRGIFGCYAIPIIPLLQGGGVLLRDMVYGVKALDTKPKPHLGFRVRPDSKGPILGAKAQNLSPKS